MALNEALRILKMYWGHTQFRSPQEKIIEAVLNKTDTLALLPTGGGKSICFQIPGLLCEGVCIVVSPLIALMKDQVENLKARGITAAAIYSGMPYREIDLYLNNALNGGLKFLYVSPERLKTELFIERFKRMHLSLLAVDEAHCISQWGYDFRPAYLEIAALREWQPNVPILALTASATPDVQTDIIQKLSFKKNYAHFVKSFKRDNVSCIIRRTDAKEKKLADVLQKVPGTAIVYTRSRKRAQEIASYLNTKGISASYYHAGLGHAKRSELQDAWISNNNRVMVSTNAFGMGIDKPDVRLVVHMDLPENLEAYYQEAGRAGRDGKKSYATILFEDADILNLQEKTEKANPDRDYVNTVYTAALNFLQIAEGAGEGESYDFDLFKFSNRFNFNSTEVFHALKKLEENYVLSFNESFYSPAMLYCAVDKSRLYEFQIANSQFDLFIKVLLRLYGGALFSEFVPIQESKIAESAQLTLIQCKQMLIHLNRLTIFNYQPQNETPKLTLLIARTEAKRLPIDKAKWESRRTLLFSKMQAVIDYTLQTEQCRMVFIQKYFGETEISDCGHCDVCIRKRKEEEAQTDSALRERILKHLRIQPLLIDELEEKIQADDPKEFSLAIQHLLENDLVRYDSLWRLHRIDN